MDAALAETVTTRPAAPVKHETLAAILREFGVKILPCNGPSIGPRQTKAAATLARLYRIGPDHLRDVLTVILESENNRLALVKPVLLAVSDVLQARADWWQSDASVWLELFDRIDLLELHGATKRGRAAVPPRHAIAAILGEELAKMFDPGRPHYRRDIPDPRPPAPEKPLERRLRLTETMVETLRRAVPGEGGRLVLPSWTPRMTRAALAVRGLAVDGDRFDLTEEGRAAVAHFRSNC